LRQRTARMRARAVGASSAARGVVSPNERGARHQRPRKRPRVRHTRDHRAPPRPFASPPNISLSAPSSSTPSRPAPPTFASAVSRSPRGTAHSLPAVRCHL
jgi:hypothetical protein